MVMNRIFANFRTFWHKLQGQRWAKAVRNKWSTLGGTAMQRVAFVAGFAVIGAFSLMFIQAATNAVDFEAENGVQSGAVLVSDSSASGGNAVMFGSSGANILAGKQFTANVADSTSEAGNPIANITDGKLTTRWISEPVSPVNADVALGGVYTLNNVTVTFAADTIKNYQIAVSNDASTWTTVATGTTNNTSSQTIAVTSFSATPKGRYLRIVGTDRWDSSYGNSIWEASATGVLDSSQPAGQVTDLVATSSATGTNVTLGWGYTGSATSNFKVTRNGSALATVTSTNYVDTTATAGTSYTYGVTATYQAGGTSNTATKTITTNGGGGGGTGTWWSGQSDTATTQNGSFATWRGRAIEIGGNWGSSQSSADAIESPMWSMAPGTPYANTPRMDYAIGAMIDNSGETWGAAASGAYDSRWAQQLQRLKTAWGSRPAGNMYIRFAHEFNGNWYPWSVSNGDVGNFKTAWARFANLRNQYFPGAQIVWCPNAGSSWAYDIRTLYPGNAYVDVVGVDKYNNYPWVNDRAGFNTEIARTSNGGPLGLETYRQFALQQGKPFAVSEWSNDGNPAGEGNQGGGDSPNYIQYFHEWLVANGSQNPQAGKVLYEVLFNVPGYSSSYYSFFPLNLETGNTETANKYAELW